MFGRFLIGGVSLYLAGELRRRDNLCVVHTVLLFQAAADLDYLCKYLCLQHLNAKNHALGVDAIVMRHLGAI